jgi:hypothetical protein
LADNGELIGGETRQDIARREDRAKATPGLDEQLVAGMMPERVVDLLEPVEVEQDDEELTA